MIFSQEALRTFEVYPPIFEYDPPLCIIHHCVYNRPFSGMSNTMIPNLVCPYIFTSDLLLFMLKNSSMTFLRNVGVSILNHETTVNTEVTQQLQTKEANSTPILSTATTEVGTSSLIGKIKHWQTTQISEDEVLGYKDLCVEAYKFSALIQLGTTY